MQEVYVPVVGWEGIYEISDRSVMRSLGRYVERVSKLGNVHRFWKEGRIIQPKIVTYGPTSTYLAVSMKRGGKQTCRQLHRLMWEAFNGPIPEGLCVLHGPALGDERHYLSNLSLGTHAQNMGEDRLRDGTDNRGSKQWKARLDDEVVRVIRSTPKGYGTGRALARRFGVSESVISSIRSGVSWSHVTV